MRAEADNLEEGLIADPSVKRVEDPPHPAESTEEAIGKMEEAAGLLRQVVRELRDAGG